MSQRIGILSLVKCVFVDTSVLRCCYYAFVLPIIEYSSPVWGSAAECHLQLLERQVYSVAWLCHDQFLVVMSSTPRCCTVYVVQSSFELESLFVQSDSICFCQSSTNRAADAAHTLELKVSRCRTSQFARCFLPAQTHVWNDLPFTVFDTGTLDGFTGAVNRWLLP